jgi:putative DNA primase/helicase
MCRCPAHMDRTPSLSIRLGTRSLLFKCFAGCDTIDVLRVLRRRNLSIPALAYPEHRLVLATGAPSMTKAARRIWDAALPIAGSLGERYLISRGLSLPSRGLRYHPATPLGPASRAQFRPAIIAALERAHEVIAIQRLFLDEEGQLAANLQKPKLGLGRPLDAAVRLAPAQAELGLAEGIESALAAHQLLGIPVWATLGSERLAHVTIPSTVRRLTLLPDADRSGRIGEGKARRAYAREGLDLRTQWPWRGHKDWNDILLDEGEGEAGPVRHAV